MAEPNVFNILKSGAVVRVAPVGTALPAATVGAGEDWDVAWLRVGATKEPVTLNYETEEHSSEVEEFLAPVRRFRNKESLALETVLAELTPDYVQLAAGGEVDETTPNLEELVIGNRAVLEEQAWAFEGVRYDESGNAAPVRFLIPRATAKLNGELKFSRRDDDYTGIPLRVQALADTEDEDNPGRLFVFQRIVSGAS